MDLSVAVLRLISKEEDRLAGLSLISSIRKRLLNLPGECAADDVLQVQSVVCAAWHRPLLWCPASLRGVSCERCGTCACCR